MKPYIHRMTAILFIATLLLGACSPEPETPTPTPIDLTAVQTSIIGTFVAGMTQTAFAMPTETLSPTATATITPLPSITPATPATSVPTQACYNMSFVDDITIDDNTIMTPGQKFTKTWLVRNSGTCAWEAGFKFTYSSGESMGGSAVVLSKAVAAGEQIELSVELITPNKVGTLQSNWRMAEASGAFFGQEVWVIIKVNTATAGTATLTPTPTEDTPTPTETDTP